jgi:ATP-binding cassette subfamily F protein 3
MFAQRQAEAAKQQREVARIQSFVDRFRAKATKAKQAQSRLKTLARMSLIAQAHVDSPLDFAFAEPAKLPSPLLRSDDASVVLGGKTILRDVRLELMPGDRFAILGPNGAGKSTLMKLLAGHYQPDSGTCIAAPDASIGYFAQHSLEQLRSDRTAIEHLADVDRAALERELRSFLGSFGFSGDRAFEPVASFSGGERARLVLALLIYQRPNVLLLDEPTNHLDLEMRFALARSLQDFSGAVLLVSHDRYLLRAVADTLLLVENGRVEQYAGDLDDYQRRSADRRSQAPDPGEGGGSGRRIQRRSSADRRERLRPLRNAVVRAEKQLQELHQRFEQIEQALTEPSLYEASSDPAQLKTLTLERVTVTRSLEQAEADWLASSEELELAEQEYGSQREIGEPAWN